MIVIFILIASVLGHDLDCIISLGWIVQILAEAIQINLELFLDILPLN